MRGRRFKTQADIERYIAQGYGQGQSEKYRPWLRVQDVPSQGRSRKVSGLKINRNYHLLSDLEFAYFVVLEFSEDVVDIREQYPLLPTSDLQQIAHERSIRYPKFAGTELPYVLTTDFLVTYRASNGTTQLAARTVKHSDALQPSKTLDRTLQKLEIERCFWLEQCVDWGIVTELSIPAALSENLQWLRQSALVDKCLRQPGIQQRFMDALELELELPL
jgi:TnsA endonuclease N terminal